MNMRTAKPSPLRLRRGKLVLPVLERVRTFDLQLHLPPYNAVALDVINSLETDQLMVFDENEQGALEGLFDGKEVNLSKGATKPISIRRWLAAGCQAIRWDIGCEIDETHRKQGVMAVYRQNAAQVMFPHDAALRGK
jgi:hypothetical protein